MSSPTLNEFLSSARGAFSRATGPLAVLLIEDSAEIDGSIRHLEQLGFETIVLVGADILLPESPDAIKVAHNMHEPEALSTVMSGIIAAAPGRWIHYCYNAEYLIFPFCETRSIGEFAQFCEEERRPHAMSYVLDLYASDLSAAPNGVDRDNAHLDRLGYYALNRVGSDGNVLDRQMDVYGGLKRRFEQYVPRQRRRIERCTVFKAAPDLHLNSEALFNKPEYNTMTCPWHNSITTALASFRSAKALRANPGSQWEIDSFMWPHAVRFQWSSEQLMDLGFIEPGQWF